MVTIRATGITDTSKDYYFLEKENGSVKLEFYSIKEATDWITATVTSCNGMLFSVVKDEDNF